MTAGTVVITGGILATVILLCIIAVLCYCRLQVLLQRNGEGDVVEMEPEGWCCRSPPRKQIWPGPRMECRRVQPDFLRGDTLQWG